MLEAGIEIALFEPDLVSQIQELNRDFFRQHLTTRPETVEQSPALKIDGIGWSKMVAGGTLQGKAWMWILSLTLTNESTKDPIGISRVLLEIERDGSHMPILQVDDAVRSMEMFADLPTSGLSKNIYLRPRESITGNLIFLDFVDPFSGVESALLTLIDTAGNTHEFRARDEFLRHD